MHPRSAFAELHDAEGRAVGSGLRRRDTQASPQPEQRASLRRRVQDPSRDESSSLHLGLQFPPPSITNALGVPLEQPSAEALARARAVLSCPGAVRNEDDDDDDDEALPEPVPVGWDWPCVPVVRDWKRDQGTGLRTLGALRSASDLAVGMCTRTLASPDPHPPASFCR